MIIELPEIHKCPKCSNGIYISDIMSCNTFGAKFWTDGQIVGDMYAESEWLLKCNECATLLWSEELERADEECRVSEPISLKKKDYLFKLDDKTLNKEKKMYLRIKLWRLGNDKRRIGGKKKELSKKEIKNLKFLYKMLEISDDEDRIMMAEIKRELGEFEQANVLLEKPFDKEFLHAVSTIKKLIEKKDVFVAKIKVP